MERRAGQDVFLHTAHAFLHGSLARFLHAVPGLFFFGLRRPLVRFGRWPLGWYRPDPGERACGLARGLAGRFNRRQWPRPERQAAFTVCSCCGAK